MKIRMRSSLLLLTLIFFFNCISGTLGVNAAEAGVEGRYLTKFDLTFTTTSSMFESSTEYTKLHSTSGHLKNIDANTNGIATITSTDWDYLVSLMQDASDIQDIYISQWIYSKHSDSGKRLPIFLTCNAFPGSSVTSSYAYFLPLDWSGWKLVSIPLSVFKRDDDSFNWGAIRKINYCRSYGSAEQDKIKDDPKVDLYLDSTIFLSSEPIAGFGLKQVNIQEGYDDVSPLTALELTYTYPLKSSEYSAQLLKESDSEENSTVECNITVNGCNVTVQPAEPLDFGGKYSLNVSAEAEDPFFSQTDLEITHNFNFGIMDEQVLLGDIQMTADTLPASGEVTASVEVITENPQDVVTLFIALYDENGVMCDLVSDNEIELDGTVSQLEVTMTQADYSNCRLVAFTTFGEDELRLATPDIVSLPAENSDAEASDTDKSEFTAFSAKIEGNDLHIEGGIASAFSRNVLLWITDENDDIIYIIPMMCDADESFNYVLNLEDMNIDSGPYTVHASGRKIEGSPRPVELFYLSIALQNKLTEGINLASSKEDVQTLFDTGSDGEAYRKAFGINELSEGMVNNIYQTLFEQKPYTNYDGVFAMASKSQSLLKELNESTWADLCEFVDTNSTILLQDEDYFGTYADNEIAVNSIYNALMSKAPFSDFSDFRSKLKTEVENYKPKAPDTGNAPSGGSSGSSGKHNYTVEKDPISKPEVTQAFNDLQSVPWAKEAIQTLYQRGVLSAADDGRFRPMDKVTREEFLKMLVEALNLKDGDAAHGFKDVDKSQWYAKYVNIAWKNGIIGGKGDGTFGVGELISREDMATMIFRAAALMHHTFESDTEGIKFNDEAAISEYALEAVRAMSAARIINGMDNNRFEPKQSASRAQSAKLIYEYVTVLGRGGE